MSKRVVRPLSKSAIWFASRIPKSVPSIVTVSFTRSARTCASVTGIWKVWCVISEAVLHAGRRERRGCAARRMALHVHGDGIHGDVRGRDLDVHGERGGIAPEALRAHPERVDGFAERLLERGAFGIRAR